MYHPSQPINNGPNKVEAFVSYGQWPNEILIPIDSQGQVGICKECKSPLGFCVESFVTWHCPQDLQNLSMSLDIMGHQ
jgi:hypothetical protein